MANWDPMKGAIRVYHSTAPTTGAKTGYNLTGAFQAFGVQAGLTAGGSTKAVVQLQGSLDGVHWVSHGGTSTATAAWLVQRSTSNKLTTHIRANVVSFSTLASTAPDVPTDLSVWVAAVR